MTPRRLSVSARLRLWNAPPDQTICLWSIMDNETLDGARESGVVSPCLEYLDGPDWGQFRRAYAWMGRQFGARVPGYTGTPLVWAWLARPSPRKAGSPGFDCSLVEIRVPRWRVLMSDFSMWHQPLNNWAVTRTEAEWDALDNKRLSQDEIEETWEQIFDLSEITDPAELAWIGGPRRDVQACIAGVQLSEISNVRLWKPEKRRS